MLKKGFLKLLFFAGIIFSITLAGCGGGAGSGGSTGGNTGGSNVSDNNGVFYNGTDIDGNNIKIEFTKPNGRASQKLEKNSGYVIMKNNKEVSRGTINTNDNFLTFKPNAGFLFNGEINDNSMYVSIVHDNKDDNFVGVMADTGSGNKETVFNVTSENFASTINEIKNKPGEYVINLTDDLLDYPGTSINGAGVKITLRGTGTNKIEWKYDPSNDLTLFGVNGGYLILENIILSRAIENTKDLPMLAIYRGMLAIRDGVIISGNGTNDGVLLKGGAFIMEGGEIRDNENAVWVDDDETSLVISGGIISGNKTGIGFGGNDAFLSITGGTIKGNSDLGIYMSGSGNHVVISGGEIRNNTNFGINIGGSRNATTMTGGLIDNNGNDGILTGGDSKNGSVTMTGGVISNHTHSGIGFHCPGPSYFVMNGGEIKGNEAGFYLRGPNSEFEITGGTIYGKNAGVNSNFKGAIVLHFTGNTGVGGTTKVLESNVDSGDFSGIINEEETDVVSDSLKPESGWVNY